MSQRVRLLLPLLLLLLIGVMALMSWLRARGEAQGPPDGPGAVQETPAPVILAEVTLGSSEVQLDLTGSAAAARSVTLYPAAAGEVAAVPFRPGQLVRAGQLLLSLVDRPQRLAVEAAAARVEQAQRLLARYEATRGTGAVPGSVIDEAQSALRLARIEERQAREALADRSLKAPFTGVVGLANVEPGDRVALDTPITTLDDRRVLLVAFEVPEAHVGRLRIDQPVSVANPAFPGRRFEGRIAQMDSRVDDRTRNLRLRAAVPNSQDLLRPGMSFDVRLLLPGEPLPAVPELALQWDSQGSHVWRVDKGLAQRVAARPVRRTDGQVLLDAPLQPGQSVVVEGVQRMRPGRRVEAIEPQPLAAPSGAAR